MWNRYQIRPRAHSGIDVGNNPMKHSENLTGREQLIITISGYNPTKSSVERRTSGVVLSNDKNNMRLAGGFTAELNCIGVA